jgi:hypothetical protein
VAFDVGASFGQTTQGCKYATRRQPSTSHLPRNHPFGYV